MASERDERIRQRAYQIWEDQGRPEGQEHEHWEQARREIGEDADSETGLQDTGERAALDDAGSAILEENLSVLGDDADATGSDPSGSLSRKRPRRSS